MLTQTEIDQRVFDLYDEYSHGQIDRRALLQRAAAATVGGLAMAQALLPRYARAQTISFTDDRIKAKYVNYKSPAGTPAKCAAIWCNPVAPRRSPACW
jgi:carboxymethylenebutenolidase